jgi:hypothetical protein
MNASLIFMLILVIGFSAVQLPYGYSLNSSSSSSTYYEKNCRNDTCVVTTCNNGQSCHTGLSENSTANTTQSQSTDEGSFEPQSQSTDEGSFEPQSQSTDEGSFETKKLDFKNFWENFLNFNK